MIVNCDLAPLLWLWSMLLLSSALQRAGKVLEQVVQEGLVDISGMGFPSPLNKTLEREVELGKQQFHTFCLYHDKGSTPAVGIVESDELRYASRGPINAIVPRTGCC